jgi:hypothetical protein
MNHKIVPEFAVLGHPNEGKSSIVSTLTEDDSVIISPTPGETQKCRSFPVFIDGKEVIHFVDTPGFQVPKKSLEWFHNYSGPANEIVQQFIAAKKNDHNFRDECELLSPIARGAGIIYVADGSRPVRLDDRAEMEILRLTAKPRMAIINSKDLNTDFSEDWKNEFRKNFNVIRIFNAHTATYKERIALLTSLKGIDQEWEPALGQVISAFKQDWDHRNQLTTGLICDLLATCLTYKAARNISNNAVENEEKNRLQNTYKEKILAFEKKTHEQIKKLFKHNIFHVDFPPHSILMEDLFSEKTWRVLGLTKVQTVAAGAAFGGATGAIIDIAVAGHSLGLFAAIGGAFGAGSALFGGQQMAKTKVIGLNIGGYRITVGPNQNIQFMYVLLDRALLYYSQIINWTHGRRNYPEENTDMLHVKTEKIGFTSSFDNKSKQICSFFFREIQKDNYGNKEIAKRKLHGVIKNFLDKQE